MKKKVLLFLFLLFAAYSAAQMVTGGYGQDDEGDVYFVTTNQAKGWNPYYGVYPMNLSNVEFYWYRKGNLRKSFTLTQNWAYGSTIAIGPELGIEFNKGDIIQVYVNGTMSISCICPYDQPGFLGKLMDSKTGRTIVGKSAKEVAKKLLRIAKKVR